MSHLPHKLFFFLLSVLLALMISGCGNGLGPGLLGSSGGGTQVTRAIITIESTPGSSTTNVGTADVAATIDTTFTIRNTGDALATELDNITLGSPFTFKGGTFPGTAGTCTATLPAGSTCQIVISFTPSSSGSKSVTLTITYKNGATASSTSSGTHTLTGFSIGGGLNTTFGTNGKITESWGASSKFREAIVLSDGKILIGGFDGSSDVVGVMRFFSDGTLDTSFGTNGKGTFGVTGSTNPALTDIAVQTDGRILIGGTATVAATAQSLVGRFLSNGVIDTTFSSDGQHNFVMGTTASSSIRSMAIDTEGRGVFLGHAHTGDEDFTVSRFLTSGALDTTFGADGVLHVNFGTYAVGEKLFLQGDKLFLIGNLGGIDNPVGLARILSDGALDTTYSTDGIVLFTLDDIDGGDYEDAVISSDGDITMIGWGTNATPNRDFKVLRLKSDGSLETDYATNGFVAFDIQSDHDEGETMFLQTDGRVIVAGGAELGGSDSATTLVRLNTDGSLDSSFGTDGIQTIVLDSDDDDRPYGITGLDDGSILVVGDEDQKGYILKIHP